MLLLLLLLHGVSVCRRSMRLLFVKQKCFMTLAGIHLPIYRRLPAILDPSPATDFSFSLHISSMRGCLTKSARVSFSGLVFSATHLLILMAALKPRLTCSMRAPALVKLADARIPPTRARYATTVPSSVRRGEHFLPPISPHDRSRRHLLFFARYSARRGFFLFFGIRG